MQCCSQECEERTQWNLDMRVGVGVYGIGVGGVYKIEVEVYR